MNRQPSEFPSTSKTMNPANEGAEVSQVGDAVALPKQLGPYAIGRQLGRGAMGAVCLATHTNLQRRVAIKVLPPAFSADQALLKRFQREMVAIGKLDHDNIVLATDAGECDGTFSSRCSTSPDAIWSSS